MDQANSAAAAGDGHHAASDGHHAASVNYQQTSDGGAGAPATSKALQPELPPVPPSQAALYKNWDANAFADSSCSDGLDRPGVWAGSESSTSSQLQALDNGITRTPVKLEVTTGKRKHSVVDSGSDVPDSAKKRSRATDKTSRFANGKDVYCWFCHKEKVAIICEGCPRSFHQKCLSQNLLEKNATINPKKYLCYYCKLDAPTATPVSPIKGVSIDELNELLLYALEGIRVAADPTFHQPVLPSVTDYSEYVIHPCDLKTMEEKAKKKQYRHQDSFHGDIHWIVHNCFIYNSSNHPLTTNAKQFFKLSGTKIVDLEVCPDCFRHHHKKPDTWFTEVCSRPHAVVWARVAGHPFWPGKCMRVNKAKGEVDVRFFGAHDQAWVALASCQLITENNCKGLSGKSKSKSTKAMDAAIKELNEHIKKVELKIGGKFPFAEPKTPLNPKRIFVPIPGVEEVDEPEEEEPVEDAVAAQEDKNDAGDDDDDDDEKRLCIAEDPIPNTPKASKAPRKQKDVVADEAPKSKAKSNGAKQTAQPSSTPVAVAEKPSTKKQTPASKAVPPAKANALDASKKSDSKPQPAPVVKGESSTPATPAETVNMVVKIKHEKESTEAATAKSSIPMTLDKVDELHKLKQEVARLEQQLEQEQVRNNNKLEQLKKQHTLAMRTAKNEFTKLKEQELTKIREEMEKRQKEKVEEVKKKQWWAACASEAIYYCCWNTSYCSYNCQTSHWSAHMSTCQQQRQTQHQHQQNNGTTAGRG